MVAPLVTLEQLKTYLGLTGAQDDLLLASVASNATRVVEAETGRYFAVASNVTRRYSTDGQTSLVVHDMPYSDATRTVSLDGTDLTQDDGYWLLPDRRTRGEEREVATTIQLRHYDVGTFRHGHGWFDKNYDSPRYLARGTPNDLVITGTVGWPDTPLDVYQMTRALAALLYWQAKSGASGFVTTPDGQEIDLSRDRPPGWEDFVTRWRLRTAVAVVG